MHLIVYMSEYVGDSASMFHDIKDIVTTSQAKNPEHGVTGILLYHKGKFLQILEGEEGELRALMRNIENDERHRNVQYLVDEGIEERSFEKWNMTFFNLSDKKSLDHDEMVEISRLYREQAVRRSDKLLKMYEELLWEGVFVAD